jgi:hypothetical protein
MAPYNFDDRNIKWNTLTLPPVGELKHLLFSILNVDGENHIVHVLFKFAANEKIILHRHMIHNNTFVVHGSRARDRLRHGHQQRLLGLERLCDRAGDTVPASSMYQTTNPATNALTGSPNTPASIAAGASQSFVIAFTLNVPFAPTIVMLGFDCTGVSAAPSNTGLNTLLLSASTTSVPILWRSWRRRRTTASCTSPGPPARTPLRWRRLMSRRAPLITATANTGSATLPLAISLCQTNPILLVDRLEPHDDDQQQRDADLRDFRDGQRQCAVPAPDQPHLRRVQRCEAIRARLDQRRGRKRDDGGAADFPKAARIRGALQAIFTIRPGIG